MSWNGYHYGIRNFSIQKLKQKYKTNCDIANNNTDANTMPKIWIRIPYLGKRSKTILHNCLKKIRRCLSHPVKFNVIYNTKKITANKDKNPLFSKSNVVYEITCPGCGKSYIGKTNRRLQTRLSEHASEDTTSAVAQHLIEHVRFLFSSNNIYDRLNDLPSNIHLTHLFRNLILDDFKGLYTDEPNSINQLLITEAHYIKLRNQN